MKNKNKIARRKFMKYLASVPIIAVGISSIATALRYIWPPDVAIAGQGKVLVAEVGDLKKLDAAKFTYYQQPAFLVLHENGEYTANSAVCTHLGCIVKWEPDMNMPDYPKPHFHCPCHRGIYDEYGKVISGPPPRPLPKYKVSVEDGKIYVTGIA
ncbi:MAG: ubiquinol-cytochrome c reductase iron-sulfur subunit [Methanosarcinales archaeon]